MRIQFGDVVFDGDAREVRRGTERVHLTPKAFDLLEILVRERPRAVAKDELRDRLWPDVTVADANLKNLVVEVRRALGATVIRTVQRFGYAFNASEEISPPSCGFVVRDRIHRLKSGENLIGRGEDCTIVLLSTSVSRKHAIVDVDDGGVTLRELGSKNGTWKNDESVVGSTPLHDGDRIRIGSVTLTFRSDVTAERTASIGGGQEPEEPR